MAKDDLQEIQGRLAFCVSETANANRQISFYLQECIEYRAQKQERETLIQARAKSPVPVALRSTVGCIVNDLRSILDNLAVVVADRGTGATRATYFPASKTKAVFETDGLKKIAAFGDADRDIVVALEPYNRPLLKALHQLDISRKHGRLTVQSAGVDAFGIDTTQRTFEIDYLLLEEPRPNIDSEWRTIARLRANIRGKIIPCSRLVFAGQPDVEGKEVSFTLGQFYEEVARIVHLFA